MIRTLKKAPKYGPFAGVCAGIGYAFDIPVPIVRMFFLILLLPTSGIGSILLYYIFDLVLPEWAPVPDDFEAVTGEHDRTRSDTESP